MITDARTDKFEKKNRYVLVSSDPGFPGYSSPAQNADKMRRKCGENRKCDFFNRSAPIAYNFNALTCLNSSAHSLNLILNHIPKTSFAPLRPCDFALNRLNPKLTKTDRFRPKSPGEYYTNKPIYSPQTSVAQVSNLLYRGLPVRRSGSMAAHRKMASGNGPKPFKHNDDRDEYARHPVKRLPAIMKLSEMRQVLTERGIQLTKSLGQNFLHDANQLKRIAAAAELGAQDKVVEIGPGLGPLTELLVEQAGEVLAIEKDARLVEFLKERFASARKLTILHADALEFLKREERDWSDWKLVANLPYSVGSPILVELAQAERPPKLMTVTLQLEVVQRLVAEVGSDDYGLLTLLVQLNYEAGVFFKIPSGSFFPPPDVDSACVTLRRRSELLKAELRAVFVKIVKRSFSQRRKMMIKLLRQDWPADRLARAFNAEAIPESARAEVVSLDQYVALTRHLSES